MTVSKRLRVLVVRHGETAENVAKIIQGQLDTPLNPVGQAQAKRTGEFLKDTKIHRAIASPLKRAADTARAIVAHQGIELELDDRLKERGFGVLEGKVYSGPAKKPEDTLGIESMTHLIERLASFWNELIVSDSEEEDEQTILVVSHGAAISALLNEVLLPGRYYDVAPGCKPARFHNCSITEIVSPVLNGDRGVAGDMARKRQWTVRPAHLDVQGVQLIRDYDMVQTLIHKGGSVSKETMHHTAKTERTLAQNPDARRLLEADGLPVENDIGYGKGIGCILSWSDVTHLANMAHANGSPEQKPDVNVDELVGK